MPAPNSIAPSRATPTCSGSGRSRVKERNSIPTSVPLPMVSASQANQPCVAPPSPDPRSGEIVSASVRASVAQAVASVAASPNTRATLRRTPKIRAASAAAPGPDAAATVPRASTAGRRGGSRGRRVARTPTTASTPSARTGLTRERSRALDASACAAVAWRPMAPAFCVTGGRPLKGTIRPAGNKNAALPILAATLLADAPCRIDNVPRIGDVETMLALLAHLGAEVRWTGDHAVEIDPAHAAPRELDPALCARIRASILLAGPMLARFGRVALPPPGGDVIGRRRVDTHLLALEQMGAEITVGDNYKFEAPARGLRPADIFLDEPSVTATENVLMAAAATPGTTVLRNTASEPHVQDLARFLTGLGAQVEGIGTNTLTVRGGKLRGAAGGRRPRPPPHRPPIR